jgi:hypothetical protein
MRTTVSGIEKVECAGYCLDEVVSDHVSARQLRGAAVQPDGGAGRFESLKTTRPQCGDHSGQHVAGAG